MNENDDRDEDDSLLGSDERRTSEVIPWDSIKLLRRKPEVGSMVKVLKVITIIVVFLMVLGTAVASKMSLLLMTSQIKRNVTRLYCNRALDQSRQYIFSIPETERTTWIWLIMLTYFIPEAGTFVRSACMMCFKTWNYPLISDIFSHLITECLSAIGSSLLVFNILPEIDVIRGAMLTNAVCFVPGILLMMKNILAWKKESMYSILLDISAVLAQATTFIALPFVENKSVLWLIPVSIFLISFGWWETFLPENSPTEFWKKATESKTEFRNSKDVSYLIVSVIKCLVFFTTAVASFAIKEGDVSFMFNNLGQAFSGHGMTVTEVASQVSGSNIGIDEAISTGITHKMFSSIGTQWSIWSVNIICTYVCYAFGKFACKIRIQGIGFMVGLSVPVLIYKLITMCQYVAQDECAYYEKFPEHLFFNSPPLLYLENCVTYRYAWIWLLWLLSQIWITQHVSKNRNAKLAPTTSLFMRSTYNAFLIDQSIAMNKRNCFNEVIIRDGDDSSEGAPSDAVKINEDKITRIYACATMWHETPEEMMNLMKSVLRMDEDQAAYRIVKQQVQYLDEDYYELETHIFFDDAFVRKSKDDNDPRLNSYVQDLLSTIDEAASQVHKTTVRIHPPVICPTPYGGRLVWALPGRTKLIVHLKDKTKIRAKKRWSQVMYMHYLLGYRIMYNKEFTEERVKTRAKNTFILTLDGDIEFQPESVHLLARYLKKKDTVGACCGRINPVGTGPMTWFQVFEYAVGHWKQKATEHVLGCILCSPGCFSLFRASALMDPNVMARYRTRSSEARHYVQYDQGEDRWLCTLLLQHGYRVEYSAAADAYTHCPEGLKEFYNQRKRWIPSTVANILDVLQDAKHIKEVNNQISTPYIWYQTILMISTVISPGTIYLMLVGAYVKMFKLSHWVAFWHNFIPISIFIITCKISRSDIQLKVAGVISAFYGFIMMAVLIVLVMQINEEGISAPSPFFFCLMLCEYIVAALVHPKEIYCLKYGIIYLLYAPSMYLLLVIYSVFNMNNVNWGTREVTEIPGKPDNVGETKPVENEKSSIVMEWLNTVRYFFGFCFQDSGHLTMINNSLELIQKKIDCIEQKVEDLEKIILNDSSEIRRTVNKGKITIMEGSRASRPLMRSRPSSLRKSTLDQPGGFQTNSIEEYVDDDSDGTPFEDLQPNSWLYDGGLTRGHVSYLDKKEEHFWMDVQEKYLHPIEDDKEKVARDLKNLRDKIVKYFFDINSLFVLVIFFITLQKENIPIYWPFNPKISFVYTRTTHENEVVITKTYLQLELMGFLFLLFFALLMSIQFIAMLVYRFETFSQIMANANLDLNLFKPKIENLSDDEILEKDPIKLFKRLIKLEGVNGDTEKGDEENVHVIRRNTVAVLAKDKDKKRTFINDLDAAFAARLKKLKKGEISDVAVSGKTMDAIKRRVSKIKRES